MNVLENLARKIKHCQKVRKELDFSLNWIQSEKIDSDWVIRLDDDERLKERVSAFVARFGRMQDYFSDKLLKAWVESVGEEPGVALENFAVAERAGLLPAGVSSQMMVGFRKLRNALVHDYFDDAQELADNLNRAIEVSRLYIEMLDRLIAYCEEHFGLDDVCQDSSAAKPNCLPKPKG